MNNHFDMKRHRQTENITLIGVEVKTFPNGIKEAFDNLVKTLGTERAYYGVSWMDDEDAVKYYAMAQEISAGEAKLHHYASLALESGEYHAEAVQDWRRKTDCIKDVFHKLLAGKKPDKFHPCIEWYQSDEEMLCMVKLPV